MKHRRNANGQDRTTNNTLNIGTKRQDNSLYNHWLNFGNLANSRFD